MKKGHAEKRSSEILGVKMEVFLRKNVIQKSWSAKKISAPGLRHWNFHISKWSLNSLLVYQLLHEILSRDIFSLLPCMFIFEGNNKVNKLLKLISEAYMYIKTVFVDLNETSFC